MPEVDSSPDDSLLGKIARGLGVVNDILGNAAAKIPDRVVAESGDHLFNVTLPAMRARKEAARARQAMRAKPPSRPFPTTQTPRTQGLTPQTHDFEGSSEVAEVAEVADLDSKQSQPPSETPESKPVSKPVSKQSPKQGSKVCGIDGCARTFGRTQALISHQVYKHGSPRTKELKGDTQE
jgi:hypothetical protein